MKTIFWLLVFGGLAFAAYWVWKGLSVALMAVFLYVVLPVLLLAILGFAIWLLVTGVAQYRENRTGVKREKIGRRERHMLLKELTKDEEK